MKSAIAPAVLGAALFSQASIAATIGHVHGQGHVHRRSVITDVANDVAEYAVSAALAAELKTKNILEGLNYAASKAIAHPIAIGNDTDAPWVMQFNNNSPDNLTLIVWHDLAQGSGSFVNVHQPDVTLTLAVNQSVWVSVDPAQNGGSVHGGFSAIDAGCGLTYAAQLNETIGEFTVVANDQWRSSTTDVSRLINMNGRPMTIENYATAQEALDPKVAPACSATKEKCAYVCPAGQDSCFPAETLIGCPYGAPNTTASPDLKDGGCGGMGENGGYINVTFE